MTLYMVDFYKHLWDTTKRGFTIGGKGKSNWHENKYFEVTSVKENLIQNNTNWRDSNGSIKSRQYYEVTGYEWLGRHDV